MSKFKVLHDLVLIKKAPAKRKTESGIHIVDNFGYKGGPVEGVVVSVGPGKYTDKGDFITVDVEPGDHVIFAQSGAKDIKALGDEFIMVPSSEVLLRLRPDTPVVPDGPQL